MVFIAMQDKKQLLNQQFKNVFRSTEIGWSFFTPILWRRNAGWHGEGTGFRPRRE
jgi:hypothetical protein